MSLEEGNDVTAKVSRAYNFLDDDNIRIYGLEIEVNNLLSASRAKEVKNKGCVGVIFVLLAVVSALGIMV